MCLCDKSQNDAIQESDLETGIIYLIMSLFRLTAQDLKYGDKQIKGEALRFIDSDWFVYLCDGLNLESNYVRRLILNGMVKWRKEYDG